MAGDVPRWSEVSRSEFTHELEGLSYIRERLPVAPPYRAWTNLTFTDNTGAMHEVDALILGRGRLHLVELKHYRGTLDGNEGKWLRNGTRVENSPLLLARRKAQRLRSRLKDELRSLARDRRWDPAEITARLPFVQQCVFLHARDLEVRLEGPARANLFAFGGRGPRDLPDIMTRLLEPPREHEVRDTDGLLLAAALTRMGIAPRASTREAGSWTIKGAPVDEGSGWQDWRAEHRHNPDDTVRIRVFTSPAGAPQSAREALRRRVKREFGLLQSLSYDSILRPREFVETEEGEPGLVYPVAAGFVPLDELGDPALTAAENLVVLERVADALAYAHRHRVAHRGLTPHSILVTRPADPATDPDIRLADWSSVGRIHQDTSAHTVLPSGPGAAGEAELYEAPEGRLSQIADRQALDVFSLGAVAYHLLAGSPPAADRTELRERLKAGNGLDLAAGGTPYVAESLRQLVLDATRPAVSERLASAAEFADRVRQERLAAAPPEDDDDPLDAPPGAVIIDRFELIKVLGEGSTARGLLVRDPAADEVRVLKVGTSAESAERLRQEADVLASLGESLPPDSGVVRLFEGPIDLPHRRTALLLSSGGETTVGQLLRHVAMTPDMLASIGGQLLDIMVTLDGAGVLHRDVKPANLGLSELIGGRNRLTLFDFSLARRGVSDLVAGTPPYLDPFLGGRDRPAYDSAAEWYAAAVVLYEMATSSTPTYGDGASDPAVIGDDVTVEPEYFTSAQDRPEVAGALTELFRRALARSAADRFDTVSALRDAWSAAFAAKRATGRRRRSEPPPPQWDQTADVPPLTDLVRSLARTAGTSGTAGRRLVYLLVPTDPGPDDVDPLATQGTFAAALGVTPGRIAQLFDRLPEKWRTSPDVGQALARLDATMRRELADTGGVSTPDLLVAALLAEHFPPADDRDPGRRRTVAGLLRLLLEGSQWFGDRLERRRFRNRIVTVAVDPLHLDVADAVAAEATRLVRTGLGIGAPMVPADRSLPRLRQVVAELVGDGDDAATAVPDHVLLRIAVAGTAEVGLSGADELHPADLPVEIAVDVVLRGLPDQQLVRPADVSSRVAARFPDLVDRVPHRPELDDLIRRVRPDLLWRADRQGYAGAQSTDRESTVGSGPGTRQGAAPRPRIGPQALAQLSDGPVFRAFEVPDGRSDRLARAFVGLLGAAWIDVTGELLGLLRGRAESANVPWSAILAADAGSAQDRQGLAAFVEQALPDLFDRIENAAPAGGPVVLTDLATLTAYGLLGRLTRWTDVTRPPPRTILALIPRGVQSGPVVDGTSLPLNSPDQFVPLSSRDVTEIVDAAAPAEEPRPAAAPRTAWCGTERRMAEIDADFAELETTMGRANGTGDTR